MILTPGKYVIKCVKVGGLTLTNYGQYHFDQDDELDLLDAGTPDTIRANDYSTASNMCEDIGFELAQRIQAGELVVVVKERPVLEP